MEDKNVTINHRESLALNNAMSIGNQLGMNISGYGKSNMIALRRAEQIILNRFERKPPIEKLEMKKKFIDEKFCLPKTPEHKVLNLKMPGFEDEYVINYFSKIILMSHPLHED